MQHHRRRQIACRAGRVELCDDTEDLGLPACEIRESVRLDVDGSSIRHRRLSAGTSGREEALAFVILKLERICEGEHRAAAGPETDAAFDVADGAVAHTRAFGEPFEGEVCVTAVLAEQFLQGYR